jgi:rhodanese-related sulfurtransferase
MFSLFQKNDANIIHVSEIDDILPDINLIDIREAYECAHGSIKGSRNIPMGQLLANPNQYMDKSKKYYIMCQSGGRSSGAVAALLRAGYDVVNVKGGMRGYSGKNRNK